MGNINHLPQSVAGIYFKWKNNKEFPEVKKNMDFGSEPFAFNEALASLFFCRQGFAD